MVEALVAPSGRDLTRTYMLAQLSARSITAPWDTEVPDPRPDRFFTIEDLNTANPHSRFTESQLIQIRAYDSDGKRCRDTAALVKGLWMAMPNELVVQDVEPAGGPTRQKDPNVPSLERYVVTAWVTVINTPA